MKKIMFMMMAVATLAVVGVRANEIAKWDPNMAVEHAVVTDGVKWIDGKYLPIEGRAFNDTSHYYDRLPSGVTTSVNEGVRGMKSHTSGMLFRFVTDSKKLIVKWKPYHSMLAMGHMPATGVSGIDIYRWDATQRRWFYVKTGMVSDYEKGGSCEISWTPGTPCIINLPLYNGIRSFELGIDTTATIQPCTHTSGIEKPVVFYGTSITHGGCASRPGLGFVNMVGRDLDVPVVGLGFSGSGVMEFEMSDHLANIDASCYVLDCLWNMGMTTSNNRKGRNVDENYEPFIRNLRAKRPDVPIVMAERCDVFCNGPTDLDRYTRALYEKLIAEGWKNLFYLPKDKMYPGDLEGTVDGCHPNDLGMRALADAFGDAVRKALEKEQGE
ncbi:MAG: SGNH/GDSL hydrolase family protein [Planctomycetia bacterium]|nr:SGNH/GDSL hydrolase family protein [Planctomycetia bacterium]